jgi:NADPH-dependent curcumin reductase CurA
MRMNRQVVLRARPRGLVTEDCFEVVERPVPELGPGEALLAVKYVGIDPTIRGWLDERGNYLPGVEIGEPIRSNGVGVVIATNDEAKFPLGRAIMAMVGWQQYRVLAADEFLPVTIVDENVALLDTLNVMGHVGLTAYLGVTEVARPEPGETFLVSAAAGGVGSVAGQIAKRRGATVIGIAGGPAKCKWVVDELGFDACIDYRTENVVDALCKACPNGIDVYFDNVGGPVLDACLLRMKRRGRIACCGVVAQYDHDVPLPGPRAVPGVVISNRLRLEGFVVLDFAERWAEARERLAGWIASGELSVLEEVVEGLEAAPSALVDVLAGRNVGKRIVRVAQP